MRRHLGLALLAATLLLLGPLAISEAQELSPISLSLQLARKSVDSAANNTNTANNQSASQDFPNNNTPLQTTFGSGDTQQNPTSMSNNHDSTQGMCLFFDVVCMCVTQVSEFVVVESKRVGNISLDVCSALGEGPPFVSHT